MSPPSGSACLQQREGTPKTLDAYQRLGCLSWPLRTGVAWSFADDHALTIGLAANFTLLSYGLVFDPNIGYSAAF